MGRFLIAVVAAGLFGASYLLVAGQRATFETREAQSNYQYQGIASNIAQSGFNRGLSAIQRDLMGVQETFERVTMSEGYYDLQISKNVYGNLEVTVEAQAGSATYSITGNVIFTAPLPAAIVVEDEEIVVSGSGFYQISGVDQRMPTHGFGGGFHDPVRGILTKYSHRDAFTSNLRLDRIVGIGSSPDDPVNTASVVGGFDEAQFEALYQEARLKAHTTVSAFTVPTLKETMVLSAANSSSADDPKIIRVQGDLTITQPMQGYGLLIVEDGNLDVASADFDWGGLILIRKQFVDTIQVTLQNTTVHGAVIAYDFDPATSLPECVPDFDLNVDEVIVNEPFRVRFKVLGAAITFGGAYDVPVTTRINVGGSSYEPWGDYDLALDGNINTGNSGVTYAWEPDTVFPAGSAVSIDARSWLKNGGASGTSNSDWYIHIERNSDDTDGQLHVLENNMPLPAVGGFMGQYSVVEFLADYIEDDKAKLTANQIVNLFELGVTDESNPAFDIQDNVVLTTLVRAGEAACESGGSNSLLAFDLRDNTEIHYSSEAIAKLGKYLDTVRSTTSVRVPASILKGHAKNETPVYVETITVDDQEEPDATGSGTVTVCHTGQDKTIAQALLAAHIGHGDYVGTCGS